MNKTNVYNGILGTTVLRGLLALAVALHHADIFNIGYFPLMPGRSAVICFFVLSGWVMTWFFYGRVKVIDWPMAWDFYSRRLCRLGPVLLINFILVCWVMGKIMPWELVGLLPIWLKPLPKFFNHILWTLVVEIEFYVFVPLVLLASNYWHQRFFKHLFVYILLFILPRVWGAMTDAQGWHGDLDMRSLAGNACYFYAGISFCVAALKEDSWFKTWGLRRLVTVMTACWLLSAVSYGLWNTLYLLFGVHAAVFGALLWIECSCRFFPRAVNAVPAWVKPLYGLGVISFGYYVFHGFCLGLLDLKKIAWAGQVVPVHSWVGFMVVVLAPVGMAWLVYVSLEKWIAHNYSKLIARLFRKGKS